MRRSIVAALLIPLLLSLGCSDDVASAGGGTDTADALEAEDISPPDVTQDSLQGEKDAEDPADSSSSEDVPAPLDAESGDVIPDAAPAPDGSEPTDVIAPEDATGEEGGETGAPDAVEEDITGEDITAEDATIPPEPDAVEEDSPCVPDCAEKQCGGDGCGGACGTCEAAEACSDEGLCECVPSCETKQCGLNGCGGICGLCPAGIPCGPTGFCIGSEPAETCGDLMECMVEIGCGCSGIDCPTDIGARLACIDSCQASAPCTTFCFSDTPEVDEELLALDSCVELQCPEVTADCLLGACEPEAEPCLEGGVLGCTDILKCVDACPSEACEATCTLEASATAVLQYEAHTNCVETLCPAEEAFCLAWASAVACPQLVPACAIVTGTGLCDVAESCTLDCGLVAPAKDCLETCMNGLDPAAAQSFGEAAACAFTACEASPAGITGACFFDALTGLACADLLQSCAPCDVDLLVDFDPAFSVSTMEVGSGGIPGESIDVDPENGPEDCAPSGNCSQGLDNQLALLTSFGINNALAESIESGSLAILGEGAGAPGAITAIHIYSGGAADASCPLQTGGCDAVLAKEAFGSDCSPIASVGNVAIAADGSFTAGGDDAVIPLPLAFEAGVTLVIPLRRAKLAGTLTVTDEGITLTDAVFGGALRKKELGETISVLPGDSFAGLSKELILGLLEAIEADIDTDGDGVDDALSIGLAVNAVPTTIVGVE